jgi:hypothetical protein
VIHVLWKSSVFQCWGVLCGMIFFLWRFYEIGTSERHYWNSNDITDAIHVNFQGGLLSQYNGLNYVFQVTNMWHYSCQGSWPIGVGSRRMYLRSSRASSRRQYIPYISVKCSSRLLIQINNANSVFHQSQPILHQQVFFSGVALRSHQLVPSTVRN